jgi:hypothetical protein
VLSPVEQFSLGYRGLGERSFIKYASTRVQWYASTREKFVDPTVQYAYFALVDTKAGNIMSVLYTVHYRVLLRYHYSTALQTRERWLPITDGSFRAI